jgi:hypothetical protein
MVKFPQTRRLIQSNFHQVFVKPCRLYRNSWKMYSRKSWITTKTIHDFVNERYWHLRMTVLTILWRPGRLLPSLPHLKIASPARALQWICTRRGGVPEQAPATGRLDSQVESDVWPGACTLPHRNGVGILSRIFTSCTYLLNGEGDSLLPPTENMTPAHWLHKCITNLIYYTMVSSLIYDYYKD